MVSCISPPELTETQLFQHLTGEAEPWVAAHLAQCPYCREQFDQLARLQDFMRTYLYRSDCPASFELGEYQLGLLPRERLADIRRHLDSCVHCAGEVAQLHGYLGQLGPEIETSPLDGVKVLIARLLGGGEQPGRPDPPLLRPAWAGVGVRGDEAGPSIYQADEAQISVEAQADSEHPNRKVVFGLVTGLSQPELLKVHLWQAGQHVTTVDVDEAGNFVVSDLTGSYELVLSGTDVEIRIPALVV